MITFRQFLKETIINDTQQADINDELAQLSQEITNYNSVPINQIKRVLSSFGFVLIDSEGKEINNVNTTLTDQENSVTYGIALRSDTVEQIGEGETQYKPTENGRISVRRNKDDEGNLSMLITLIDTGE